MNGRLRELRPALREVRRAEAALAALCGRAASDAEVAAALDGAAGGVEPRWWEVAEAMISARSVHTAAGPAWRMARHFPVPRDTAAFLAVRLARPDSYAVVLDPRACPGGGGVLLRRSVGRVFAARGWRFPGDLARPDAWAALWTLFWAGADPGFTPRPGTLRPPPATLSPDAGELTLPGTWSSGRPGTVRLRWTPTRIDGTWTLDDGG